MAVLPPQDPIRHLPVSHLQAVDEAVVVRAMQEPLVVPVVVLQVEPVQAQDQQAILPQPVLRRAILVVPARPGQLTEVAVAEAPAQPAPRA